MATVAAEPRPRTAAGPVDIKRRRRRGGVTRGRPAGRVLAYVFALIVIVVALFPVYLMFVTSILPNTRLRAGTTSIIPAEVTLQHYRDALDEDLFLSNLRNSLTVTIISTLVTAVLAFLAAAAMGRFRFRGRTIYLVMLLIFQMIPLEALIIPIFLQMRDVEQLDKLTTLIAVYVVFNLPFAIWVLRSFVMSVPPELEEQAMIDGCSRLGAFWRVLLPLVVPGLVATAVYAFIQSWGELVFALTLMQDNSNKTLPAWIATFNTPRGIDWGALMAGSIIFTVPAVVMFLFVYKRIAAGLAAGAVKG